MNWTSELRRRLTRLARKHPHLEPGPPAAVDTVAAFEQRHRVELPEEYRRFLLEVGTGGGCWDGRLLPLPLTVELCRGRLAVPFAPPASPGDAPGGDGILFICERGCNYGTGLVVTGSERGNLWTWVEEWPGWVPATDGLGPGEQRQTFRPWMETWVDSHLD